MQKTATERRLVLPSQSIEEKEATMARFPPSALAALLAVVSSTSSSSGGEHSPFGGASAYIPPPNELSEQSSRIQQIPTTKCQSATLPIHIHVSRGVPIGIIVVVVHVPPPV